MAKLVGLRGKFMASAALSTVLAATGVHAQATDSTGMETIVVTATRREESLQKVPISVAAFSQSQLDERGLKDIDGIAKYTPGLVISRSANGGNNISIRGISSTAGAATTGIYLDDTPVQVRNVGYNPGNAFPALFDLERVEVLRGPQGTLFGAGSEGGTVRFIQTTPSLTNSSAYARGELSFTDGGDPSYEAGAAYGAPIVEGQSGFRASVFYRKDGGWIDGVSGTPVVLDPAGHRPSDLTFSNVKVTRPNTNWVATIGGRVAFKFEPTDSIEITPSVSYQRIHHNDGYNTFWPSVSSNGNYARPVFDNSVPEGNAQLNPLTGVPSTDDGNDRFIMPALAASWDLGPVKLFSNTSYFDRDSTQWFDFTEYYLWLYSAPNDPSVLPYPTPGQKSGSKYFDGQRNFTQELRLQSTDDSARLTWVLGGFYSDSRLHVIQRIPANFLAYQPSITFFYLPSFLAAVDDGPPFGPGHSAFENFFGIPANYSSDYSMWSIDFSAKDKQEAAFAQGDLKLWGGLKLTAGLRYSHTEGIFQSAYSDAEGNLNAPYGDPALGLNSFYDPTLGEPVFATGFVKSTGHALTPKIGLSYQIDPDNMVYATASKGFRPAGANQKLPSVCNPELVADGYADGSGNAKQPLTYDSDSVWSYELGTKNTLFGGRLVANASGYYIRWSHIQTPLFLNNCAEDFVVNLGNAVSSGFDLGLQLLPVSNLSITAAIGYNKSSFAQDVASPGGVFVANKDGTVPGSPAPWVYSISAQYNFDFLDDRKFFIRGDLTGSSRMRRVGANDPKAPNYNPDLQPIAAYFTLGARLGAELFDSKGSLELFVNNLTDEHPDLALANHGINSGFRYYSWTNQTIRPRTIGLFMSYRY